MWESYNYLHEDSAKNMCKSDRNITFFQLCYYI